MDIEAFRVVLRNALARIIDNFDGAAFGDAKELVVRHLERMTLRSVLS